MNDVENSKKHFQCVIPLDKKRVLLVDPEKFERNILRQNRQYEKQFCYDATFGPSSSQSDVHSATTAQIVEYVFLGYNATVFAYGPTGSGKTYTMVGTRENPGLMTLLTHTLYERIDVEKHSVYLSYMELYNENIRDLLNPSSGILDLMEDEKGNIQIPGLSKVIAPNSAKILQILQEGNSRRTQEATAINNSSSRSHALLQVTLYKRNVAFGKLYLIDLAGSERASQTQNRGLRLKEGAAINRSLLALGNVINSLSSGNKGRYVNYRDSKLTRLLKDSLGGNSKTCMIAHVTPSSAHYEETYNTLVYASRAMNITLRLTRSRPASADQPYTNAMRQINRELQERSNIVHASSSQQISGKSPTANKGVALSNGGNRLTAPRSQPTAPRKFSSLFNSLKEQYLDLVDKQHKLRERLLEANQEAYEAEMSRTSKLAILSAWDKQKSEVRRNQKTAESIARLRKDVDEQEKRLGELVELRRKLEKALRKGNETAVSVEARLRSAAKQTEQIEMIALLVRMAETDAEKMAIKSDWVLQGLRLNRINNSFAKVQRYEMVADRLIDGTYEEYNREQLQQEYRVIKNQIQFSLLPLRQNTTVISWNTQFLNRSAAKHIARIDEMNVTHKVRASQLGDSYVHLPLITDSTSIRTRDRLTLSTQTDNRRGL
ncbi:Kinesin-like protein KIF19 [Toxocara canis]|uniref:Kinesin-like protein n=1 Tax=Toxocara canis TaxID=6265 RepID=A0A0B2VFX8_TOXCA|nr:Kinesin-like protein KIF19 [Toxocara canis]